MPAAICRVSASSAASTPAWIVLHGSTAPPVPPPQPSASLATSAASTATVAALAVVAENAMSTRASTTTAGKREMGITFQIDLPQPNLERAPPGEPGMRTATRLAADGLLTQAQSAKLNTFASAL